MSAPLGCDDPLLWEEVLGKQTQASSGPEPQWVQPVHGTFAWTKAKRQLKQRATALAKSAVQMTAYEAAMLASLMRDPEPIMARATDYSEVMGRLFKMERR